MAISLQKGERKMKKLLVFVIFVFLAAALSLNAQEQKWNLQKAYVFLEEEMLVNESDLNCSYFIKDEVPRDIRIVAANLDTARNDFSDLDEMVINRGAKDGLKEGDLLTVMAEGQVIRHPRNHDRLGRYFLKKSLAQVTCVYDDRAVVRLQGGCNPVRIGDFAIPYKPEQTVFEKRFNYKSCRIPANAVTGQVVYADLTLGLPAELSGDTQYISVDLGEGVVGRGTSLLINRTLASDLPPLIIGLGIVIHSENTNSTVKILDSANNIQVGDHVLVLPKPAAAAAKAQGEMESLPIVEALPGEGQEGQPVAEGEVAVPAPGEGLNFGILFEFDTTQPVADHAADYAAIRDFIAGKAEYLVTLRGYTCSIGGDEYNLRLSSRRAEAIKAILVSQYGIDPGHIESFFYGEKQPQFDNSSEAERRKNRLVKIEVNAK
jgi:outer membrane protein OmpA-like peptidoglycan-associated protein